MRHAALVPIVFLVAATSASAATRYASPNGNNSTPSCPASSPCDLSTAIEQAANGDEVVVEAGNYTPSSDINFETKQNLNIHGPSTGPLPTITQTTAATVLEMGQHSSVSRLAFVATNEPANAIELYSQTGDVLDDLIVEQASAGGVGVSLASGDVLRDSVVYSSSSASNVTGVEGLADLTGSPDIYLRNDTVEVGTGGAGIVSYGVCGESLSPGCGGEAETDLSLKNVIARGGSADLSANTSEFGSVTSVINVDHSNYRASKVMESEGSLVKNDGANQTNVDPSLTPDFHELPGSVTIDAGTTDPLNGSFDIDGNPRWYGSAPDIGAYEFPEQPIVALSSPTVLAARAIARGTVNPRHVAATFQFLWGSTPALGRTAPVRGGSVPVTDAPRPVSASLTGLSPGRRYYYRLSATTAAGTQSTAVRSFTTKPLITGLRETHRSFRVGSGRGRGTVLSFDLEGGSRVRIAIVRLLPGRRVRGVCRAPAKRRRRDPRCTRIVVVGTLTRTAHDGLNKVPFSGRVGGKALAPRGYRAVLTALGPGGGSALASLGFTILKG